MEEFSDRYGKVVPAVPDGTPEMQTHRDLQTGGRLMFPFIASSHRMMYTQNICAAFRSRRERVMDTVAKTVQCVCTMR